jgi:hypothetical protein
MALSASITGQGVGMAGVALAVERPQPQAYTGRMASDRASNTAKQQAQSECHASGQRNVELTAWRFSKAGCGWP